MSMNTVRAPKTFQHPPRSLDITGGKIKIAEAIGEIMVNPDLLNILRCPVCVKEEKGSLTLTRDVWLICSDCNRKYPIVEDIPVMLITEGDKWQKTDISSLPVPPPYPD